MPSGQQGQDDIIQGIERRQEIIELEDEADVVPPEAGESGIAGGDQVDAVDAQLPPGGPVDPAQQVQQGGLAAAAGADDDDEFPPIYRQVHIAHGNDFFIAAQVDFPQPCRLDQFRGTCSNGQASLLGQANSRFQRCANSRMLRGCQTRIGPAQLFSSYCFLHKYLHLIQVNLQ